MEQSTNIKTLKRKVTKERISDALCELHRAHEYFSKAQKTADKPTRHKLEKIKHTISPLIVDGSHVMMEVGD